MNPLGLINSFLQASSSDCKVGPAHIALYLAIIKCGIDQECGTTVVLNIAALMQTAKIYSERTYHKVMRELSEYGYLKYMPSTNRWTKSMVQLTN